MDDDPRDRLLAAVRAANQSGPVKFDTPSSVEVGQVRRLRAYDDELDSMLVLLLHVDDDAGWAKLIGVTSPADEATVRDLVVQRETAGSPFDLVLRVDGVATAWTTQLSETPVVCSLPKRIVDLARRSRMKTNELATEAEAAGISTGSLRPQIGDPLWWDIGRTAEHLATLTDACHEAMLKPAIADPAILPSLFLRGNEADQAAFFALCDARDKDAVQLSPESFESWGEFPRSNLCKQDLLRLLERRFLQDALRFATTDISMATVGSEEPTVRPARDVPSSLPGDPLARLVGRCAGAGEQSTRVWTTGHLWREESSVFHTTVGGHRHAILAEVGTLSEERE